MAVWLRDYCADVAWSCSVLEEVVATAAVPEAAALAEAFLLFSSALRHLQRSSYLWNTG